MLESFLRLSSEEQEATKELLFLILDRGDPVGADVELNILWLATRDGEVPALAGLELHAHAGDVGLDGVDDVLMASFVAGDQTKVICVWQSDG